MVLSVRHQLKAARGWVAAFYLPAFVLLGAGVFFSHRSGVNFGNLTRDPTYLMRMSPFVGVYSNLGVLMWAATAAVCFYTAAIVKRFGKRNNHAGFFLASGFITLILLVDDLFLVHETIAPYLFNITEIITFGVYGLVFAAYAYWFRSVLQATDYVILLAAILLFGGSLVFDQIYNAVSTWQYLYEDGLKWFAIVSWMTYYCKTSYDEVKRTLHKGNR
ncbi:MAG: hypothetical protein V1875_07655 [Candidatus Altiarchaeota archaeon]